MAFLLTSVTQAERHTLATKHRILAEGPPRVIRRFVNDFFDSDTTPSEEELESHHYVILWLQCDLLALLTSEKLLDALVCLVMDYGGTISIPRALWRRYRSRGIAVHLKEHDMGATLHVRDAPDGAA